MTDAYRRTQTKTYYNMKTTQKQIDAHTSRTVVASRTPYNPKNRPVIGRIHLDSAKQCHVKMGTVLGCDDGKPCAFMINVQRGDIVAIRENIHGNPDYRWLCFRIDDNFGMQALKRPDRLMAHKEILGPFEKTDTAAKNQINAPDEDVRIFLAETHPGWLKSIVAAQLERWRVSDPWALFRYAPWCADNISDQNLRAFAEIHHSSALDLRVYMSPRKRSVLLSASYKNHVLSKKEISLPDLHLEIIDSITKFPNEWFKCHYNDCWSLFTSLKHMGSLEVNAAILRKFVDEIPQGEYRKMIAEYISQAI